MTGYSGHTLYLGATAPRDRVLVVHKEGRRLNEHKARQERLRLQRATGPTMCSGWRFHCTCPRHGSIFDRYEAALRANNERAVITLRTEIESQAHALGRTHATP